MEMEIETVIETETVIEIEMEIETDRDTGGGDRERCCYRCRWRIGMRKDKQKTHINLASNE